MKFYHSILTFFIVFYLQDNLWSEQVGSVTSNSSEKDTNQSSLTDEQYEGLEKIRLFDGSELTGRLIKLDKNQNLHWENKAASGPINFKFKSVSNITFDRLSKNQIQPELKSLRLYLRNGDKLRCKFQQLTDDHFFVDTGFSNALKIPLFAIEKLSFFHPAMSRCTTHHLVWKTGKKVTTNLGAIRKVTLFQFSREVLEESFLKKKHSKLNLKPNGKDHFI